MNFHPDWVIRPCPCCHQFSFNPSAEISSRLQAEHCSFNDVRASFVGLRDKQMFFSYHRCLVCHTLYCPRYFSKHQLETLYAAMPDNLMGEEKSVAAKTQLGYFKWFSNRNKDSSRFLEIGPDIGLLTESFLSNYSISSATLVEPNKLMHAQLERLSANISDFSVVSRFEDVNQNDFFDTIVAIHVLDHLLEPVETLRSIRLTSTSYSSFLIVVHDEASTLRRLLHTKWPPFCLQHPQLYSKKTLATVLRNSGWEIEFHGKSTNWQSLKHFSKVGAKVFGINEKWFDWMPSCQVPFRLGNQIALAKPIKD